MMYFNTTRHDKCNGSHICNLSTIRCVIPMSENHDHYLSKHYASALQWRIMSVMASQITEVSIVGSTVCSCRHRLKRKHQSSALLGFVMGIHRLAMDSPQKGSVIPLQWHHNGRDSVLNHQLHDCLLNHLFNAGRMASNAENVSIWCRHHDGKCFIFMCECISFN